MTHSAKLTPEPQDFAMEAFRIEFPVIARCWVSDDGKLMTYNLGKCQFGSGLLWLKRARDIINNNNLPLTALTYENIAGYNFGNTTLFITYKDAAI